MGWKNIKETFCPDMDVFVDENYVHIYFDGFEVIRIFKEDFDIFVSYNYEPEPTIISLAYTLGEAKHNGILKKLLDDPDTFERDLPIFTIKNNRVVKDFCEEYGHLNLTHSGEVMLGSYFKNKEEAREYLKRRTTATLRLAFKYLRVRKTKNGIVRFIKAIWAWIKVRV
ncbi:MAG: hypothetical protein NC410_09200 [Oscillibacter sp.]|nr:hypothetical protein [Oscillibacter sp.]